MGEFRDGVCHGFATMQAPAEADEIQMATGAWRQGRLHGYATVLFHNGDKYVGEWRDGKRHGFGFCTYADGSVYHGEWQGDLRHSYGVYNGSDRASRYLGLWDHGHRHGSGVLIKDGSYFEGSFFAGHMQGPGLLVTGTGATRAVAEFGNDALLQGRGSLWLSDGHIFEGSLMGAWAQAGGVRLNGTLYSRPGAALAHGEALLSSLDNLGAFLSDSDMFAPGQQEGGFEPVAFGTGLAGSQGQAGPGFHDQRQSGEGDRDAVNHLCQRRWRDVPADVKWAGLFARCKKEVRRVSSRMGGNKCVRASLLLFSPPPSFFAPQCELVDFFSCLAPLAQFRAAPGRRASGAVCGPLLQLSGSDAATPQLDRHPVCCAWFGKLPRRRLCVTLTSTFAVSILFPPFSHPLSGRVARCLVCLV